MSNQIATNTTSYAYRLGVQDATAGKPLSPVFWQPQQQADYTAGYRSIKPVTKPQPQPRRKRTTNATWERQMQAAKRRQDRLDAMFADILTFCPEFLSGEPLNPITVGQ